MGGPSSAHFRQPEASAQAPAADDAALELLDVPAAVLCAVCGSPDCQGCSTTETQASGVIAIVPWERPGQRLPTRLLSTARIATTASELFFSTLPDGEILPALRFAVLAELVAVSGLALVLAPVGVLIAPWLVHALLIDSALRDAALRALVSGIPGVAFAMVAVHAAHGLGLDWGARRQGAQGRRGRGLRFGLYSCGWDMLTLPIGIAMVALSDGPRRALSTAVLGLTVPGRAARAYLRGIHQLEDTQVDAASRFALAVAGVVIFASTAFVLLLVQLR